MRALLAMSLLVVAIAQYKNNTKDNAKKMLVSQIKQCLGQVTTLRQRFGTLKDELKKQDNLLAKCKYENADLLAMNQKPVVIKDVDVKAYTKDELTQFVKPLQKTTEECTTQVNSIKRERDSNNKQLNEKQLEHQRLRTEYQQYIAKQTTRVEALLAQLNEVIDIKMSQELEIACYKNLLESKTQKGQLEEQTKGVESCIATNLTDINGQSS